MSKKVSYNEIKDATIDWGRDEENGLPYSGQSVQNYLRKHTQMAVDNKNNKIESIAWDPSTMSHLIFDSAEKYQEWLDSGDNSLAKQIVPFQIAGRQKRILINALDGSTTFYYTTESTTANITVSIKLQSKEIDDVLWEDETQDTFVTVAVDRGNSGMWTDVVSNKRVPYGENLTVDVRSYLAAGTNRVRFTAIDELGEKQSSAIFYANLTSLSLRASDFSWYTPYIEGQPFNLGGMYIGGNLKKKLRIHISDEDHYQADYTEDLGNATYTNVAYYYKDLPFPTAGTGVYGVEIWLEAEGVQSSHLKYNIMCVKAEEQHTAQLVAISNIPLTVKNYDSNTLFSYACYNKGLSEATPHILIQSEINEHPTTIVSEMLTVATGIEHNYVQSLEVETSEENLMLTATITYGNSQVAHYKIDNSLSFPAVSNGLSIYINPVNRSNAQENKLYIVNEHNGEETLASWSNVAFIDGMDGWTTDAEGRKCLLIPATGSVEIPYTPLLNATKTRSLEFAYKVTTAADSNEDILTIASSAASDFVGVKIKPTNVLLHSKLKYEQDIKQSYNTKDEEFVHVFITLVQNYKQIANLAQIYVNGVKACSFEWSNGDDFNTSAAIKIGSNTADIYLYKLRVYDTGFEWPSVIQNYISCLPDAESKKAAYEKINSVIFDGVIDYDQVVKQGYNYFLVRLPEGTKLPSAVSKTSVKGCRLMVDIKQNPSFVINGTFDNVETEGQGTTAMNYFRWNLRWKTPSVRITAKKNFASSMHSHKMGATALFNDLNRMIVGANEADARVAVEQYPAYGFLEIPIEGAKGQYIYEPIGLYTIGQDKGDKPTFGYNNKEYKDTLIHLEGTDHSPKGVGMDYPWAKLNVATNSDGDTNLGVQKSDGTVAAAWEIGACGAAESDSDMYAYLTQEFKPAYDCDYRNTPMLIGFDEGIEALEILNAYASQIRAVDAGNGFTVGDCLIWFKGDYNIYYYDVVEEKYMRDPEGLNILTDLGITESDLNGQNAYEQNEEICALRKARYRAEMENYWNLRDSLFHYCFIVLLAATDNFKKNTYPYKFGTLASGSRWRWRQDDLDTLFDINNQGLANKVYSILNGDKSGDTHLFRGNTSYHWINIQQYYEVEVRAMMREIMTAMANLCPAGYGESAIEKCIGCIRHYFWDKAQGYFTQSAYNLDAEWTYEDAWAASKKGQYAEPVHPLEQSLGNHYEAERAWVELRFLFMASIYGFGAFDVGHDQDTSTGQISFRPAQGENVFNLTPIINMNPTILVGDSDSKSANGRVFAGNSATIPVSTDGDTSIYIQGVDYLSDIGDFSKIKLYAENPALTVSSKRLKTLKVGGATAGNPDLSTLTINNCPSLMEVDARNTPKLVGTVSLKNCPRLRKALFGGSSASEIELPAGCKITEFQLPDTLKNLSLVGLPNLSEDGLSYNTLNALTFLRVEGNSNLDGFALMKVALRSDSHALKNIRIVGFDYYGDAKDIDLLAKFAEGGYFGIDENGNADNSIIPFLEGTLHVDGSVYEDTTKIVSDLYAGRISLDIQGGFYLRFADDAVKEVLLKNMFPDEATRPAGLTTADVEKVTSIGTWFNSNANIEYFDEFEKFTGVTTLGVNNTSSAPFYNCISLKSIKVPKSVTRINIGSFAGCTSLQSVGDLSNVEYLTNAVFLKSKLTNMDVYLPKLTSDFYREEFYGTEIKKVSSLGSLAKISSGANNTTTGSFGNCSNLEEVVLPDTLTVIGQSSFYNDVALRVINIPQNVATISNNAFFGCTSLEIPDLSLPNLTSLGQNAFYGVKIKKISNLGKITALPTATSSTQNFGDRSMLEEVVLPSTVTDITNVSFCQYVALKSLKNTANIASIKSDAFNGCSSLDGDLDFPKLAGTLDSRAFYGTAIKSFSAPMLEIIGGTGSQTRVFAYCKLLESVNIPSVTIVGSDSFAGCSSLKDVIFGNLINIYSYAFYGCSSLKAIDLKSAITSIADNAFTSCGALSEVIVRATTVPALGSKAFEKTPIEAKTGYIYVPDASVDAYKAATNWASYASNIKGISSLQTDNPTLYNEIKDYV